ICAMAALAASFGGLAVAAFDRDDKGPTSLSRRAPWLALAAVGLFVGYESRGGLLGIAVPMLGVGLAWVASRAAVQGGKATPAGKADPVGAAVGVSSLVVGAAVAGMAVRALAGEGK